MQSPKRAWKLQEFVAHSASVTCLALGHKSGRVLVTGGEDKKVNLWAVGKPNCIMSLSGHNTGIDCVRFGDSEELVCAGSQSGALKIWDLEAARLVRTLTGHKSGIKCVDFHPYGDFLSSGSSDTSVRLWDTRRKGCIFSYKGHTAQVNSVKFSPDGQWISSAGQEGVVKMWDLRAGKQLTELAHHAGPVSDVEFHPHEFLLASGSEDRTVVLWDLETFSLVGGSGGDRERGAVRCLYFHPEGETMFTATPDTLRVCGWEPLKTHDIVSLAWGKVRDIAVASNQLIGASHHGSHVQLWVIDLKRVQPYSGVVVPEKDTGNVTFRNNQPARRSFVKDKSKPGAGARPPAQVKIEECSDKSGTDGDDSDVANAEIMNLTHHENIFQPRTRQLNRTPPIEPPFEAPVEAVSMPQPVRAVDPMNFHASHTSKTRPSPAGVRRASQPSLSSSYGSTGSGGGHSGALHNQVQGRRGSTTGIDRGTGQGTEGLKPQEVHMRPHSLATQPRPVSVADPGHMKHGSSSGSPVRAGYRTNINLGAAAANSEYLPQPARPHTSSPTKLYPMHPPSSPVKSFPPQMLGGPALVPEYPGIMPPSPLKSQANSQGFLPPGPQSRPTGAPLDRPTPVRHRSQQDPSPSRRFESTEPKQPEEENIKLVPSMADKPVGLQAEDFLSEKFGKMSTFGLGGSQGASFGWPQAELSESEVTSSILKGHGNMMAVLTQRARNTEIVRQLWHSKDAKTAVEQAVSFNDPSVIVDLLSVIVLRPSIWNLDLCLLLIPPIGELLLSKYESYVNTSASALKLILKNFSPVIKSNIDTPCNTVGVDISKEERARKCMDCYRELVKIRSGVLKRQTMQGKAGHSYRELAILMQMID